MSKDLGVGELQSNIMRLSVFWGGKRAECVNENETQVKRI
jgi:hypothetical protein